LSDTIIHPMAEFLTFSKFYTKEETEAFAALLDSNNILFDAERLTAQLDNIYLGEDSEPRYLVKVQKEDFGKVESLMKGEMEKQIDDVPANYYLFQFSNEELTDVMRKPDEWNYFDQLLARKLLLQRNVEVSSITEGSVFMQEDLYVPARIETGWLIFAYLMAVLVPFAGIPLGLLMCKGQRTLKDGTKMPLFDNWTYKQGWILFGIGVLRTLQYFFLSL
jgi:hypothetical protein